MTPPKKTPQEEITQMRFEFKDYKKAFAVWKENIPIYGDSMQMVISDHPYTSGYWIESLGKMAFPDRSYVGDQVLELEKRVLEVIKKAAGHSVNHVIY